MSGRDDHNEIKVHFARPDGKPLCRVQASVYQPHQMATRWDRVTCLRCSQQLLIDRRKAKRSDNANL